MTGLQRITSWLFQRPYPEYCRGLGRDFPVDRLAKGGGDRAFGGGILLDNPIVTRPRQPNTFRGQCELARQGFAVRIEQEDEALVAHEVCRAIHLAGPGPVGQVHPGLEIRDVLPPPLQPFANLRLVGFEYSGLDGQVEQQVG